MDESERRRDRNAEAGWRPAASRVPRLRQRNMRIGLGASGAVLVANVAYLAITLDRPNRPALLALQMLAITVGIVAVAAPGGRSGAWLEARLHRHVSTGGALVFWGASQTALILLAMGLDGGLTSPMTLLLFVPLLMGSSTFSQRFVALCAAGNVGGVFVVGALTGTLNAGTSTLLPVVLASTALAASIAGRSVWELASQLDRANLALEELARADSLTGCLNHRSFHQELASALANESGPDAITAVLLIDIDHFKRINDRYGHPAGDEVLVAIAEGITASLRAEDVLGRTGGEEFAVLLPGSGVDTALAIGERVRTSIAALAGVPEPITASIGVAISWGVATTPVALVNAADRAMYDAKHAGRDQMVVAGSAAR
jgi:diguanylate cyclase (GGDEF)-like protein